MAVRKGMKEFKYTREFLDRLFSDDLHAKPVCRATKLATIRTALQVQAPPPIPDFKGYRDRCEFLTGHRPDECPHCRGTMVVILLLEPTLPHQAARRRGCGHLRSDMGATPLGDWSHCPPPKP
jgi:hypothetical protein